MNELITKVFVEQPLALPESANYQMRIKVFIICIILSPGGKMPISKANTKEKKPNNKANKKNCTFSLKIVCQLYLFMLL